MRGRSGVIGSRHDRTSVEHPLRFATVREPVLIRRSRSPSFATIQVGRICKQGVVRSSPIVSTFDPIV